MRALTRREALKVARDQPLMATTRNHPTAEEDDMFAKSIDEPKLRNCHVTVGQTFAPYLSCDAAMGPADQPMMIAQHDDDLLHMTLASKPIKPYLENVKLDTNQKVVYSVSNPISATGGVVGLNGSLAPEGAIVKVAGMTKLQIKSVAQCSDCEDDAVAIIDAGKNANGDILTIDAGKGTFDFKVPADELDRRRNAGKALANPNQSGRLRNIAVQFGSALNRAVICPGGKAEVVY